MLPNGTILEHRNRAQVVEVVGRTEAGDTLVYDSRLDETYILDSIDLAKYDIVMDYRIDSFSDLDELEVMSLVHRY